MRNTTRTTPRGISATLILMSICGPAFAQTRNGASPAMSALLDCRTIADDAGRLACFDKASATLGDRVAAGTLIVAEREAVVRSKQREFGLPAAARPRVVQTPLGDTDVAEISATIAAVGPAGYGRYRLRLSNGMVWDTAEPALYPPEVKQAIRITRGSLGAYRAFIGKSRSIQVKRVG